MARPSPASARPPRAAAITGLLGTWQGWIILLLVAVPLALPLHYYLVRRDPHDERFAWRMFSPMRMTSCTVRATAGGAPVALERELHEAWLALARRGRFVVIERMGARLCEQHAGQPVVFRLECTYLGRPAESWGGFDICQVPLL